MENDYLEIESFLAEQSERILSDLFGNSVKMTLNEGESVTAETIQGMFSSPAVSIRVGWEAVGGEVVLVLEQSVLVDLLNRRGGGESLEVSDEEGVRSAAQQFFDGYFKELGGVVSERLERGVPFGSTSMLPVDQLGDAPDISTFKRLDLNVSVGDDFSGLMIKLLSPEVVRAYTEKGVVEEKGNAASNEGKVDVQMSEFTPLQGKSSGTGGGRSVDMLLDLELPIAVELGRVRMFVKDILELGPGSVVELNKFSGEPVDLYVNNKKFAEGEVVVIDQNFGVRITALVGPNERLSSLR